MCLSIMFIYHIQYQDWASLHSTASKHQSIYHFLYFSWPAHIDRAYSKVLNIACAADEILQAWYSDADLKTECKF